MALLKIPVVKGKGTVEIDTDTIPEAMYAAALEAGLKVLVNGGTSKITKAQYPNEEELKAAAMAKANERVSEINAGTLKIAGKKAASKTSGAVNTEAMRLAKALVKDSMREQGLKISHYKASEITAAAKVMLEQMPELITQAEENLAKRKETPVAQKVDLASIMKADPELVAKADAKKKPLSAKQAGMTAKQKKGRAAQATA